MNGYLIYAGSAAIWSYLKGETQRQPTYVQDARKRIRRSIWNLAESFPDAMPAIEQGNYRGALLVYAATIGEFHPLVPVIDSYMRRWPATPLVILSGQVQYVSALRSAYPTAAVGIPPPGAPWLYERLFKLIAPRIVVIGEGPCLHLRFPIPFELALPAACLRHSIPMVVANATMFPAQASSRLDRIKDRVFGWIHSTAVRYWYAPNDLFRTWLVEAGVPEARIVVTGDLRFDGLRELRECSPEFRDLLDHLRSLGEPIVVAGSVNAIDEQGPVIEGWQRVRERFAGARLIIAPRHVNNSENMAKLYEYLHKAGLRYARRSEGTEKAKQSEILVVDVFGELPYYYSVATAAYIGRNHTLLEPLRFRVPTVVAPRSDWAPRYVTFPGYMRMVEGQGVVEAPDKAHFGEIFLRIIEEPAYGNAIVANASRIAESEKGAGERIVTHLATYCH